MTAMPDTDQIRQLQVRLEQMQSRRAGSVPKEVAEFAGRFAAMLEAMNGPGAGKTPTANGLLSAGSTPEEGAGRSHAVGPAVATLIAQGGFDSVSGGDPAPELASAAGDGAAKPKDMLLGGGPVDARWMAMLLADD